MSSRKFTIKQALKPGYATPTRKTKPKNPESSNYSPHVVAVDFSPSDLEVVKNEQKRDEDMAKAAQEARAKIEAEAYGKSRKGGKSRRRRHRRSAKSRK